MMVFCSFFVSVLVVVVASLFHSRRLENILLFIVTVVVVIICLLFKPKIALIQVYSLESIFVFSWKREFLFVVVECFIRKWFHFHKYNLFFVFFIFINTFRKNIWQKIWILLIFCLFVCVFCVLNLNKGRNMQILDDNK